MFGRQTEPEIQIGRFFTFLLCIIGLSLVGVFTIKLLSSSLKIAFTDFLLLASGIAFTHIGIKYNFSKFIFSQGGQQRVNFLFFNIGLILSGLLIVLKIFAGATSSYRRSLEEGGIVEWASFLLLILSAYILFWCARLVRPLSLKIIYYTLSAFSFVIGMEEMSWGQILFRWKTPAQISIINTQSETNLHNIQFVHGHADLAYGTILVVIIAVSLSVDSLVRPRSKSFISNILSYVAPSKLLIVYFAPACALILFLYFDMHEYSYSFTFKGEEEVAEMLGALGLLGYSISQVSQFSRLARKA